MVPLQPQAMQDMVTADTGWGTLKLYKVQKQLIEIVKTWQTFPFLKSSDYYKYAEICKISPNLVCNEEKLKTKLNKVGSRAVCFETR